MDMRTLARAKEMSVRFGEFGQRIGQGGRVDFDRVVGKTKNPGGQIVDVTVGRLLEGRHDLFERVDAQQESPAQPASPLDIEDVEDDAQE